MENNTSDQRTERILNSLDGLQRAAAPDFFYTRLLGKMQPVAEKKQSFILRPAFIAAALSVLLLANVISLSKTGNTTKQPGMKIRIDQPAGIESFAKAYNMNSESVYE